MTKSKGSSSSKRCHNKSTHHAKASAPSQAAAPVRRQVTVSIPCGDTKIDTVVDIVPNPTVEHALQDAVMESAATHEERLRAYFTQQRTLRLHPPSAAPGADPRQFDEAALTAQLLVSPDAQAAALAQKGPPEHSPGSFVAIVPQAAANRWIISWRSTTGREGDRKQLAQFRDCLLATPALGRDS